MRKTTLFFAVVAIIIASSGVYAEEQKVSPKVEQVSKQLGITIDEATKLVQNMQELAQIMGVKMPADEKEKENSPKSADKKITGPEVANKVLGMAGNAISII